MEYEEERIVDGCRERYRHNSSLRWMPATLNTSGVDLAFPKGYQRKVFAPARIVVVR
jgi:hypothetical protein